jgi:rod shape determining protein RodA
VALFSANGGMDGDIGETKKQVMWFLIGFAVMCVVVILDYEVLGKLWKFLFAISTLLLIGVLFTTPINGATSWFNFGGISLQPSEFSKIALILGLGKMIQKAKEKEKINSIWTLILLMLFIFIPIGLVIMQPDYGTAMVMLVIAGFMIFVAGLDYRYVLAAIILVVVGVPLAYEYVLPAHAKARIDVFLDPQLDPQGAGYNIIQAKLAVGSGQMWGMGLLEGNQTQLGYLPMKVTDFIFAVISEEMGFVVSSLVVILFVLLIVRGFCIAKDADDLYGKLIAVGVTSMYLAHFLENVGMNIGLMPITGIPLPFISYGGSSMVTNFIGLGLLLNVSGKKSKKLFDY